MKTLYIILIAFLLASCSPSPAQITATANMVVAETKTAAPTLTPTMTYTPSPTSTPAPTSTPTATLTPTPAPVSLTVSYGSLEITVLYVTGHASFYPGAGILYKPKPGYLIVEMGVSIHNSNTGTPVPVKWGEAYIIDATGDKQIPLWGAMKTASDGRKVDPSYLSFGGFANDDNTIELDHDTYLRLAYGVKGDQNQLFIFGVQNSPQIGFNVK